MGRRRKSTIKFICSECEEEFKASKYYSVSKGDKFCYKATSPCCSASSKSVRDEPLPISKGVDRVAPKMKHRDFTGKKPLVDVEGAAKHHEEKAKQSEEEKDEKLKPSGIKVGTNRKIPDIPMRLSENDG